MFSQLEEDYGTAKRSMSILERATQVVADEDKFEVSFSAWVIDPPPLIFSLSAQMFTIYIAKATANFGLPATRPIYEKAIEGDSFSSDDKIFSLSQAFCCTFSFARQTNCGNVSPLRGT